MPISQVLQDIIASVPDDFADPSADFQAVRKMFAPFHSQPVDPAVDVSIVDYGGVRCGRYRLQDTGENRPVAFHCHGGAFVSTPLDEYHFYAAIVARQTGCNVVMPDYRLAPEHTYPAAHDDCFNAYCGLLESGINPRQVVLFGESCGGSLALALLVRLRDARLPLPACFVSLTGWYDLSVTGPAVAGHDPFLTPEWVRNRGRDYVAGKLDLDDPTVSPAYADLQGLPPLYLQVGTKDTLREGALLLASRAVRAGVPVTLQAWPEMIHGWHGLVAAGVPEAAAAWAEIRAYIEAKLSPFPTS